MKEHTTIETVAEWFVKYKGNENELIKQITENGLLKRNTRKVKNIAIYYYRIGRGGVQRVISLLAPLFQELGYQCTVIAEEIEPGNDYALPENVEIIKIPTEREAIATKEFQERAQRWTQILTEKEIDTVIYNAASSSILLFDLLACKLIDANFVVLKHEFFSHFIASNDDLYFKISKVYALADRLVVLSEIEKKIWNALGIEADCIPNPIKECSYVNEDNNKKEIVWVGRLDKQKQYWDCLEIMEFVVKKIPDAVLKLYGSEPVAGVADQFLEEAKKRNLESNIQYCGYVNDDEDTIYKNAKVHIVTSVSESYGMTIAESKLRGIPLVLYKMPYLELLKDKKGYIAVEHDDKKAMAAAIIELFENNCLYERLSEEAICSIEHISNKEIQQSWRNLFLGMEKNNWMTKEEVFSKEDVNITLETILYHYHKGIGAKKEAILNSERKYIKKLLNLANSVEPQQFVIYPFGDKGRVVQSIIEEMGMKEAFIVDNQLSKFDEAIKNIDALKNIDCTKYMFLICSDNPACYKEIRQNLRTVVPESNILDLF